MKQSVGQHRTQATASDHHVRLAVLLGVLSAAPSLAIDMYIPALPDVASDLGAAASQVQLSLTGFLVGLAVGQVVAGPVSDRIGRRPPILVGITLFSLANVACALSGNGPMLIAARVLAGMTSAAGLVVARAVVTDKYGGSDADRFFAMLLTLSGVAPALAPLSGGLLLQVMNWRGVFAVIAALTVLITLASIVLLPETLDPGEHVEAARTGPAVCHLLTSWRFLRYAVAVGLSFASLFAVISGAPFFLQHQYGLSALETSLCLAVNGIGITIAGQISTHTVGRIGPHLLVLAGLGVAAAGGALMLITFAFHACSSSPRQHCSWRCPLSVWYCPTPPLWPWPHRRQRDRPEQPQPCSASHSSRSEDSLRLCPVSGVPPLFPSGSSSSRSQSPGLPSSVRDATERSYQKHLRLQRAAADDPRQRCPQSKADAGSSNTARHDQSRM